MAISIIDIAILINEVEREGPLNMRSNELEVLVNWGDTDKAGIVYYPNFFKWFDIAGHQFFRSCDLAPAKLEEATRNHYPALRCPMYL